MMLHISPRLIALYCSTIFLSLSAMEGERLLIEPFLYFQPIRQDAQEGEIFGGNLYREHRNQEKQVGTITLQKMSPCSWDVVLKSDDRSIPSVGSSENYHWCFITHERKKSLMHIVHGVGLPSTHHAPERNKFITDKVDFFLDSVKVTKCLPKSKKARLDLFGLLMKKAILLIMKKSTGGSARSLSVPSRDIADLNRKMVDLVLGKEKIEPKRSCLSVAIPFLAGSAFTFFVWAVKTTLG